MPSRVSARSSQSSAPSAKSRSSTATRSQVAQDILEDGPDTSLRRSLCVIFAEAQASNNGQRKLVVRLRKIQESCCYESGQDSRKPSSHDEFDEHDFNTEIARCVLRVLPVKKSEPVGDRTVRFLGVFLKQATDSDNAIFNQAGSEQDVPAAPETPSTRLTSAIISLLIPILPSKDKVIRFRATQIVAHLINTLDSVDEDLFDSIRLGLLKRLRDKESTVRVQAVYGLGRLAGEADQPDDANSDSDDDAAGGVLTKLLDVLQNDPSSDVRRALLLNLPFTPSTLPYLLERARDLDGGIRRALYSRLLPALGDFRHLSLTHREKLLRWGLRDRDDNVKKATAKLFKERWIEDCACPRDDNGEPIPLKPGQVSDPSLDGLLELLERIDVVNAGTETGVALDAMKEFWAGRPDYCDYIAFDETYWKDLTPESVFVARTFNDFCQSPNNKNFQDKMPEVTRFAYLLQENINKLVEMVQKSAVQDDSEEETVQQEFVVEQLLHIALTLDYSDEIGRRTMFSLMRGGLALAELPEEATKLIIEVLRTTCGSNLHGERELSSIALEAIAEVHDNIIGDDSDFNQPRPENDADDSFHSARSEISDQGTPREKIIDPEMEEERAIREIMVNMKCLHIAQCMLQNVECTVEQNPDIVTMLNNLVVPAVRSMEAPIRERGLLCLGLCCLLDKNLAEENLALFLKCFSKGHEALQIIAIQIIGDVLNAHPTLLMVPSSQSDGTVGTPDVSQEPTLRKDIQKLFSKSLKSASPSVQATACTALSKLMLSSPANTASGEYSILDHDDLLRQLTIAYFDPETAGNPALRQSLSYFLPVYCHSRFSNMQRMARIAMGVLLWCFGIKEEMDVDMDGNSHDLVGLNVVTSHLADWTDGRRLTAALAVIGDDNKEEIGGDVHLELAGEIIERALGSSSSKDQRKLYLSMLGKLHVSANSSIERLNSVLDLVTEAIEEKVAVDASARNVLAKMQSSISKAISSQNRPNGSGQGGLHALDSQENIEPSRDSDGRPRSADDETPIPSPRKPSASPRKRKNPVAVLDEQSLANNTSPVNNDGRVEAVEEVEGSVLDDEQPNQSNPPNSRNKIANRPKWQVAELEQQDFDAANSTKTEAADVSVVGEPNASPARKGRTHRTSMQSGIDSVEPTPIPRQRTRNVRSSRRKEQSIASIATAAEGTDFDESALL